MWPLAQYLIKREVIALDDLNWIMPLSRMALGLIIAGDYSSQTSLTMDG